MANVEGRCARSSGHLCLTREKRCWRDGRGEKKDHGGCLGSGDIILAYALSEVFTVWPVEARPSTR